MSELKNMRSASYLLPDPGGDVVRSLLDQIEAKDAEIERLRDCILRMEQAWLTDLTTSARWGAQNAYRHIQRILRGEG